MIVVLGAGISGLAAAARLEEAGAPYALLEREGEPGGLCRSYREGPFSFDLSGHFLHTAGEGHRLLDPLLSPRRMARVRRDARVASRGVVTPFPFQANLHGRPPDEVRRMVRGYARALEERALGGSPGPANYREWLASRFGDAMCRAFFYPYNRKTWRLPLEELVPSWADWSIPLPSYEELLAGASGKRTEGFGYNASFLYPRGGGGIGSLARRMAAPVRRRTTLSFDAARVDLRRRVVADREGREVRYDRLVSTVPLPALCAMAEGLPAELRRRGGLLRWTRILTVNWGVRGTADTGHWSYAPDRDVPYFRVGCYSAVDRGSAPEGFSSLFTDMAFPGGGGRIAVPREVERCRAALARQGVIRRPADAVAASPVLLDPGYVVFDRNRAPAVAALSSFLAGKGVALAGRYGLWDYFGMERSILSGFRAADAALGG